MLIGYARVSTDDQTLDLQRDALTAAGCERIFEDTAGGAAERPNLHQAHSYLRTGDTLVVWRLDRLGRSLKDLIARAEELRNNGIGLKSLKEAIDTDSRTGSWPSTSSELAQSSNALSSENARRPACRQRAPEVDSGDAGNASTPANDPTP